MNNESMIASQEVCLDESLTELLIHTLGQIEDVPRFIQGELILLDWEREYQIDTGTGYTIRDLVLQINETEEQLERICQVAILIRRFLFNKGVNILPNGKFNEGYHDEFPYFIYEDP